MHIGYLKEREEEKKMTRKKANNEPSVDVWSIGWRCWRCDAKCLPLVLMPAEVR